MSDNVKRIIDSLADKYIENMNTTELLFSAACHVVRDKEDFVVSLQSSLRRLKIAASDSPYTIAQLEKEFEWLQSRLAQ